MCCGLVPQYGIPSRSGAMHSVVSGFVFDVTAVRS